MYFPFNSLSRLFVAPLLFLTLFVLTLNLQSISYAMSLEIPPKVMKKYLNQPEAVGFAKVSVSTFNVYDVALFAPNGVWNADQPFAIRIVYQISISGKELAKLAIKEMEKIYNINKKDADKWLEQMSKIFPDITPNSEILAIQDKNNYSVFYFNNQKLGSIDDQLFSKILFSIWLGENTHNHEIRDKLFGNTKNDTHQISKATIKTFE